MQTIRRWRGEFGSVPPFDIGPDTLVAGYSLWAEMTCFLGAGLAIPSPRLRFAHGFPFRQQYPAATQSRRGSPEAAQTAVGCLPPLRHCWLGEQSTRKRLPGRSAKAAGASTVRPSYSNIARKTRANLRIVARASLPVTGHTPRSTRERSCVGACTAPRASPEFRRAACRSTCRCGIWCRRTGQGRGRADQAFRPELRQRVPIYSPEGEWSNERFAHWLVAAGISEWPRLTVRRAGYRAVTPFV